MKKNITSCVLFLLFVQSFSQKNVVITNVNEADSALHNIQLFSTEGGDMESESDQQELSSLLLSSKDVFTQFAAFQFGSLRYRMRGYHGKNHNVMVNGIGMNNPETGYSGWSSWGGLNDVTRYVESRTGNTGSRYNFSGAGGYTNIDAGASSFKKGSRFSYAYGNRIFRNRLMFTHATGMSSSGWAFSFSASLRRGEEVYIPGTYFRGNSFYFSAQRKKGKHITGLTGFVAPSEQGRANPAQMEAFELSGDNFYNSAWGYQDGKIRNANVSRSFRPVFIFSDTWHFSEEGRLSASVYFITGRSGITGLNRYDAPNPKPDYYRYLPSYYYLKGDTAAGDRLRDSWELESTRQINWNRMISMNQNNLYSDPKLNGQIINTTETRARYMLENRVEDIRNPGLNILYNLRRKNTFISSGLQAYDYASRKFKEAEDLLGASFWLDVDQFAEDLGVEDYLRQNDIDNPDRKVRNGEKFGYDYSIHVRRAELWSQMEHNLRKIELYAGFSLSFSKVWREGFMANGKFPETSRGTSDRLDFLNGGIKSGFNYKISGRQFITANTMLVSRPPDVNNVFVSPRVRNDMVSGITNEQVFSADLNYHLKYPRLKMRFSLYHTGFRNQVWLRTFWHDAYNTNVNMIMKGVDQWNRGLEFGLEKNVNDAHAMQLMTGYGHYIYRGRPQLEAWQDNNSRALFEGRTVYLDHYRVGGTPQFISGIGYKYNGRKRWFVTLNLNYAAANFLEPNPDRRTAEATERFLDNERGIAALITDQQELPACYFMNLFCGKSFRVARKYYANVYLSVNNLLNNKKIISSGFEQLRWNPSEIGLFPPKYYYMPGTAYLLIMNFNF